MSIELRMLALSIVLGLVHMQATGMFSTAQNGIAYGMGPRDEPRPTKGIGGRVERAYANWMQSFPLFAAAVLIAEAAGAHNGLTRTGVQLYFWARLAYVPLYAAGIPVVRTLVWGVATLGIVLVLFGLL